MTENEKPKPPYSREQKIYEDEKLYPFSTKLKGKVLTELRRQVVQMDRASADRWTIPRHLSNLILCNKTSKIKFDN